MSFPRRVSRLDDLSSSGLRQDVRAHQRTYEGAYTRTAVSCLSFSVVIVKLFSLEFLPIGTVYTAYGCLLYFIGCIKARHIDAYYSHQSKLEGFKSAGDSVILLSSVSLATYIALLVLVLRL